MQRPDAFRCPRNLDFDQIGKDESSCLWISREMNCANGRYT
jgi:hypothetical protein